MRSPIVAAIAWGQTDLADGSRYKDVKLFPGGAREWDWAQTGTRHRPGIQVADVEELLANGAELVVLSRGMDLQLQVAPETLVFLADKGIPVHVLETREAVAKYNELVATAMVGALIHSTC